MNLKDVLEHGAEYFIPNLSIDLVVIGYSDEQLKCLLLRMDDRWLLPGGYIRLDESVDDAVTRILMERTRLDDPHFKFLTVFGDKDRKFDAELKRAFDKKGWSWKNEYWINNRFITLAYYSLVDMGKTHPVPGVFDEGVGWFDFDELPDMWLDHRSIVMTARERLKYDIKHEQLTYNLLPERFTMPALHKLHQTILEEKLDRSRFQKKMLALGIFERLPRLKKETPGSNPYQYRLKNGRFE